MTKHHGTMSHATMSKHHDAMSHATMSKDAMMKHDSMTKTTDGK